MAGRRDVSKGETVGEVDQARAVVLLPAPLPSAAEIVEALRRDNPAARACDLVIFADALRTYTEAARNVREFGAVCAHPRTGAPIPNPYLEVQGAAARTLGRLRALASTSAMALLDPASVAGAPDGRAAVPETLPSGFGMSIDSIAGAIGKGAKRG